MNQTTFSFPHMVSRTNKKTLLSTQNKSINECLGILLRTRIGELLGDPNYGCMLIERIFLYNGVIIPTLLKEDIIRAVNDYEPRISMSEQDIDIVQEIDVVHIFIQYIIKETGVINTFNFDITADDNPFK